VAAAEHRVAAVIPALNEAAAVGQLTTGLLANGACCVFVVDGGSTDGTADVARVAGAMVVEERRRGYGRACLTGAERAAAVHPVIAFLDGDGSCDPDDLPRLVAALERDESELERDRPNLVLGTRSGPAIEPGALPWHARAGNLLVAWLLRQRTGRAVHDLPPFKVIRRETLVALDLDDDGFGWTVQLIARALRDPGLRIVEVPARFRRRWGGQSKVSGNLRASIAAGRRMIACALAETSDPGRPLIALMAKAPRPGHAKTRLAADIGQGPAIELWTACLADLGPAVRAATRGLADTIAVVPSTEDAPAVAELLGPGWSIVIQQRPGLGGAIVDAFEAGAARGADRVIAVSGDNPTLPPDRLLGALEALRASPSVLGPCPDGGYYLVGARLGPRAGRPSLGRSRQNQDLVSRLARAYQAAVLGGGTALQSTTGALTAEGLPPRLLEAWPDIDTAADLANLEASLDHRRPAPRTRAWLETHAGLITRSPVPAADQRLQNRSG
jgi:glycosyltransferase A (GT-A) superfamily protein (DUF2064 family)